MILLDQMPRNIHRGSPAAFMHDTQAAAHCIVGIESGQDCSLDPVELVEEDTMPRSRPPLKKCAVPAPVCDRQWRAEC